MDRRVVLIAGPPGAGKSTLARSLGLAVLDRDAYAGAVPFDTAARRLADDPGARAAVIASCPRAADRDRWAAMVGATEVRLLAVEPRTCRRRVHASGGQRQRLAGIDSWWAAHRADPWTVALPPSRQW